MAKKLGLRQWGIEMFGLPTGPLNAITDVQGVGVGHCTIAHGDSVRTGVTAILPHSATYLQTKCLQP